MEIHLSQILPCVGKRAKTDSAMSNAFWMDSGGPVETAEMLSVERKNVSHPMNDHGGGDKAGIMHL